MAGWAHSGGDARVIAGKVDGLAALTLRGAALQVTVVPELGGKIVSLRRITPDGTEDEALWRNPRRQLALPTYGGAFDAGDISAFDECFPGIGAGPYPAAAWTGCANPDHGEVWALPWQVEAREDAIRMSVHGVRFPYLLEREIAFVGPDCLALRYRVTNHAAVAMPYVWSAHPLFAVTPTTRIVLPSGVAEVTIDSSVGDRLGQPYQRIGWPHTVDRAGQTVDLSRISPGAGHGDKLYATTPPGEGWCALHDEASGAYVGFAFDPVQVPYIGVWINQDGWPADGPSCFNVAIEPCTGWPDSLERAMAEGTMRSLPPHGSHTWELRLTAGYAPVGGLTPWRWAEDPG